MLGYVHGGQPTVILRVSASFSVNAWICARRSTDRDPANVIFNEIYNVCNFCDVCDGCSFHADALISN